jgi:hypothetical protein
MNWSDGSEQCCVTAMEAKLRGTWQPGYKKEDNDNDDSPEFIRPLMNKLVTPMGLHITKPQALVIVNLIVIGSGLVAFLRYATIKNISLVPKDIASKAVCAVMGLSAILYIVNVNYTSLTSETHVILSKQVPRDIIGGSLDMVTTRLPFDT